MSSRANSSMARALAGAGRVPWSWAGIRTFSSTVRLPSRLKNWNTNPSRARRKRARRASLSRPRSSPATRTRPPLGRSTPATKLSRVDFPLPEGPMIAVNSPPSMARLTPSRATRPPAPSSPVISCLDLLSAGIHPIEVGLGVQDRPHVQQDQVVAALGPGLFLEDGQVLEPLEVDPALAGKQGGQAAVGDPRRQQQLEVDLLPQLLGLRLRLGQPGLERLATRFGQAVGKPAAVAPGLGRLDQPVPLQPLQGGVDLADVDLPRPPQEVLEARLDGIGVQRLLGQEPENPELERHPSPHTYSAMVFQYAYWKTIVNGSPGPDLSEALVRACRLAVSS